MTKEVVYGAVGFIGGAVLGAVVGGGMGFLGSEANYYMNHQAFGPLTSPEIFPMTALLAGYCALPTGLVGGVVGVDVARYMKTPSVVSRTRGGRVN